METSRRRAAGRGELLSRRGRHRSYAWTRSQLGAGAGDVAVLDVVARDWARLDDAGREPYEALAAKDLARSAAARRCRPDGEPYGESASGAAKNVEDGLRGNSVERRRGDAAAATWIVSVERRRGDARAAAWIVLW